MLPAEITLGKGQTQDGCCGARVATFLFGDEIITLKEYEEQCCILYSSFFPTQECLDLVGPVVCFFGIILHTFGLIYAWTQCMIVSTA